ncbi:ImmA/IrrE family metallo-endopeptidase [Bacillus idriensis]|uniref:ImmA/IrrE family metallo-endopeptidase n=1 Tax=Metabacillus idriensis TaxID=324768 RepID=A0A6I2MBY5_9BACI|nr:ImmA/IrrE family metallo-endopeptidase [Metabacillus idriensis]MRX54792.1 ImmA/IrrE family metallo-endopeptidase [Metabacillus idriensis]
MKYQKTILEEDVQKLYIKLSINAPEEINMYSIAEAFDIWIHYRDQNSEMQCINGLYSIILNENLSFAGMWQDFGHELGHVVKHVGKQHALGRSFRDLQESQANNFMYHFCVPTFMLMNYEINDFLNVQAGIPFIAETFNVTQEFAERRLVMFRNQILQAKMDEEHRRYMESMYPKVNPENYSDETKEILSKLNCQVAAKESLINAYTENILRSCK